MRADDLLDELEKLRRQDIQRYIDNWGIAALAFCGLYVFTMRWEQCLILAGVIGVLRASRAMQISRLKAQPIIDTLRDLLQHEDYREALKPLCYKHRVVRNLVKTYIGLEFKK
jgi:hypothetical protein